jgi:signal transduction histidine kinase
MIQLKVRLALFNLLSKLVFSGLFLVFMPYMVERINLTEVDKDLIQKREKVIDIISKIGIEPFITPDSSKAFGSYDILKEEFISLEKVNTEEDLNFIEVTQRIIENENIGYRVLNYTFKADGQKYLVEIGKSLTSILYARKNISQVILVFLSFIIIITFLTDLQYNRYLLSPLNKITRKLRGISNPSTFDITPVRTKTSDFHMLDSALREMINNLDEQFQKEKEITVNISHELLTPISVLRSKLENIFLRKDLEPEIAVRIEESLRTLHRLQSLVSSLLFIARVESRQYLMEDTFSIKKLLLEIITEIRPIAEDSNIMITEDLKKDFQLTEASRTLIFSMFYNVVNNAVKNTPANGLIIIKSALQQKNIFIVSISDSGKGMNEEKMSKLFSRFRSRTEDDPNSNGIGLAITKSIADLHSINVTVTSTEERGTTFSFYISKNS